MTAPAVCGIYFLYREGELIYVGQSFDCRKRITAHRNHGREFDTATIMPLAADALDDIEKALIKSLAPKGNVKHARVATEFKIISADGAPAPRRQNGLARLGLSSLWQAKTILDQYGVPPVCLKSAWGKAELPLIEKPLGAKAKEYVRTCDVVAFAKAEQARLGSYLDLSLDHPHMAQVLRSVWKNRSASGTVQ